jgi:DNA-binding CsgD family transcriptional regulator
MVRPVWARHAWPRKRSASRSEAERRVERAVGHPATREIPLGALAHLLPADHTTEAGIAEDERTALFHAARAELRRLAGDNRLVLLVDDLDLLDDTSVAVLVPLLVSRSVFLVATVRAGRSPADQLAVLHRDGHLVRMELGPLDVEELGALLHRALDGPVAESARAELARLSGGNLQMLRELVRGALEHGALEYRGDAWHLTGPLPTTGALEELVAEHVAAVDASGRAVLDLLAVCERFGLDDLAQVHGLPLLESLETNGLIFTVASDRRIAVRLAHPLYGEVLRAGLSPLQHRRIQAELADVIESHGARRRDDIVQVAHWRVASGGKVGGEQLVRAVRLALAGRDPNLAIRLVNAADDAVLPPLDRAEMLVEASAMSADLTEVERVVASVWDDAMGDSRRAHFAKRLADTRFYRDRDLAGALAAHGAARERVTDADVVAMIDARRATLLASAGRPGDALRIAQAIESTNSPSVSVELGGALAVSLLAVGRFDEAVRFARQAAVQHASLPVRSVRRGLAQHTLNEAHALLYSGRYTEARALLEPAADRAWASHDIGPWVWFEMALAELERDTGRGRAAIRRFQRVATEAEEAGQEAALVWAHVGVAQGHLLLGQCAEAAAALVRADAVGDSPVATSIGTRERARAWLDACRGDLASARQRIRDLIPTAREDEVYIFELALLHDLARFGVPEEAVDRLNLLAERIDGPSAAIHAAHARALVDRDVSAQRAVVDDYEAIDALGLAAEASAELAEFHRARAENREATAASRRAAELADRAGGLRTPPLARGDAVEPLTQREREIALLAAAGRTSRDIGSHLGLSARTVDTHLTRVYRKLGIGSRAELGTALERL